MANRIGAVAIARFMHGRAGVLLLGLILAVALTLNAAIFYHNTRTLVDDEQWVSHTQTVLSTLDTATTHIAEAQNGLRAYLFAGNADDLRRCRRAVAATGTDITTVAHLTADNPTEQGRIRLLRRALPPVIPKDLLPDGLPIEYADLHQVRGPALDIATRLDRMQTIITSMKTSEVRLLEQRIDAARQATVGTYITLAVATVADLVLLAGLLAVVLRTLRRRAERAHAQAILLESEQAARTDAEAAVAARDAFLSLASHELKTPLTAVLGNAQLLQLRLRAKKELTDKDAPRLDALTRGARQLVTLVEQLLDVSRLQRGQLDLTPAPLDVVELVRRAVDNARHGAGHHRIVVNASDGPLCVMGDDVRLEQVIANLLTNAIKFSPDADVVAVDVTHDDATARITVVDQGIGIPPAALARLFDRFYRAPNANDNAVAGLGIGLYVVHEIVTRHGGTILVRSAEGQGSAFTVEIPLLIEERQEGRTPHSRLDSALPQ